jgi:hypothetical protein
MFCESWREPLTDAAISGEQPSRDAASHLSGCGACRSAFAEERQLFAAIDHGLHAAANAEVPASLVPRVRVAIAEQPARTAWRIPVWAFAGAALLVIAALAYEWSRPTHSARLPEVTDSTPAAPPQPKISDPGPRFVVAPPALTPSVQPTTARTVSTRREPEVLVTGEDHANLLRYLNQVRARNVNSAAPQVIVAGDTSIKPLEIVQLDMPELTIKPLEDGDSR